MQLELPFVTTEKPSPEALRVRVITVGRELLARARAHWPHADLPDVRVEFRLRGRAAGEACARTATTNYNAELLEKYGDDFIVEIVPHEIAHVVAGRVFPGRIRPHGREWRTVMEFFGARASVTHGFETKPARRHGQVPYQCRCDSLHYLTTRAHRRIRRGTVEYSCRRCRTRLEFAGRTHKRQP
jgi:SprT protein